MIPIVHKIFRKTHTTIRNAQTTERLLEKNKGDAIKGKYNSGV